MTAAATGREWRWRLATGVLAALLGAAAASLIIVGQERVSLLLDLALTATGALGGVVGARRLPAPGWFGRALVVGLLPLAPFTLYLYLTGVGQALGGDPIAAERFAACLGVAAWWLIAAVPIIPVLLGIAVFVQLHFQWRSAPARQQ